MTNQFHIWADKTPAQAPKKSAEPLTTWQKTLLKVEGKNPADYEPVKCRECVHTRIDRAMCEYASPPCRGCDICKKPSKCAFRLEDKICPKQKITWTAYECGNRDSEFYRALLNVSEDGDTQAQITWEGCPCGERRRS